MLLIPFIKKEHRFQAARTEDWREITEEEFHALSEKARAGDEEAQLALGYFYLDQAERKIEMLRSLPSGSPNLKGVAVLWDRNPVSYAAEEDRRTALAWFLKAAGKGCIDAIYQASVCYIRGEGTPVFFDKGAQLLEKAALAGHIQAQYELGMLYRHGQMSETGTYVEFPQNASLAAQWLQKAAEQGDVLAQYQLALCYEEGAGVEKDKKKAFFWHSRAAEGEYPCVWSFSKLGECYETGNGVEKDRNAAVAWYKKAAEQGDEEAYNALERLSES